MTPVDFKEANHVMGKPETWHEEDCQSLPTYYGVSQLHDGSNSPFLVSCWKLSEEELKRINETGVVWLFIHSNGMPPVSLTAINPFVENASL